MQPEIIGSKIVVTMILQGLGQNLLVLKNTQRCNQPIELLLF